MFLNVMRFWQLLIVYLGFSTENYGPRNQKFEFFRKSLRKFNALLREWKSLTQVFLFLFSVTEYYKYFQA